MNLDVLNNQHSDEIAAFLAVASQGSFVAAGRLLQRHPTIVSKRLAAMEKRLGVRLVERSTRQVRITQVGSKLEERLRAAIDLMDAAQQQAAEGANEVRGTLRLALPAAMGRRWLGPMLPEFLRDHPHVSILADYSERLVDIIDEGFDVAIRIGELEDNRLIAMQLSDHRRILCASPAYIEKHGMPETPHDLIEHNCLRFSGLASFPQWKLYRGSEFQTVLPKGNLTANDSESLLAAACADSGILGAGEWLIRHDIAAGKLLHVLPDWQLDTAGGVYLVRPSSKFPSAVVTAFKKWVESKFIPAPPWAI
ncbi:MULTISPECIES: LysR family transcriptional regulator [unclassified Pseudomonas]|uniref:LysR family transcriptional regulator n=1 Tax=unclassified Pseudomonas TaxID=196821 RepID=UPI0008765795|nr:MULTISPECIES: LysR family transcriptional regulator [unclassified Pseudomonas]SCZ57424.1 transcriptional regulator, LysR family [Pseudomonas sp. NFPP17]SDA49009.1 transcriptional regulator, LysR family [Pseudomonas sp. NFPP15]SEK17883.1 transcriptional regulator, LysR family [Pseudomonas sp. NFPP18]SFA48216.1 transcriptional regulator, LysR family [Pseudomonas sp. NFPP13]SFT53598.1 transcriptional regulator, LysR family [Pseudomonas sp. NFPP25]